MPSIASLNVKIGADIKRLERGLSKAQRKIQDAGRSMQRVGRNLTMAVTAPLAGIGGMALKTAGEFELLRQSMDILNGSVEEGARNFERLKEFSAGTPFQLRDLAEAQNMLQGFGLSADEAFDSMSMIGDIAAVASGNIKGIGIAFGQAAAEGRLMTRDIRQLINQGVPAIKLLADTMNVAESEVLDLASQGKISFEILQKSFRDATSEGGMFANGMAQQAQTLTGRFSTMKDNISLALGSIGSEMGGLAKQIMGWVIDMSRAFRNLSDRTKQIGITIGLVAAAIPPLIFVAGKLAVAIGAIISPVGLVIAGLTTLAGLATYVYKNWDAFKDRFLRLWVIVKNNIIDAVFSMTSALQKFFGAIPGMANMFAGLQAKILSFKSTVPNKEDAADFQSWGQFVNSVGSDVGSMFDWLRSKIFRAKKEAKEFKNVDFSVSLSGMEDVRNPLSGMDKQLSGVPNSLNNINQSLSITDIALGDTASSWQRFKNEFKSAGKQAKLTSDAVTTAFQSMADESISSLNDLVKVTINTARKIISAEIAKGVAAAVRGALTNVPFPFNIAAAAGAGAAASGLFNSIVPKLAQGGLAFGPTMAMVGDNQGARTDPEVISPLSKLENMMGGGTQKVIVEGEIRNDHIYISNQRGENRFR